jgi:hypothetical protein
VKGASRKLEQFYISPSQGCVDGYRRKTCTLRGCGTGKNVIEQIAWHGSGASDLGRLCEISEFLPVHT